MGDSWRRIHSMAWSLEKPKDPILLLYTGEVRREGWFHPWHLNVVGPMPAGSEQNNEPKSGQLMECPLTFCPNNS